MRSLARAVALVSLLAAPTAALAATASGRVLVPNCSRAVYKPHRIILACGDGSNQLIQLHWSRWTTRSATGSGVDEVNDCTPDCVNGHFHAYPAIVTLSRPKSCRHPAGIRRPRVFGRIVVQYPGAHPGSSSKMTSPLACPF
jgi:hypothetical protein